MTSHASWHERPARRCMPESVPRSDALHPHLTAASRTSAKDQMS